MAAGRGLPQFQTILVGREDDIVAVMARLGSYRVVTLVGFGGTGKTRLAIEVGHQWAAEPGRSAHFVDLTADDDLLASLGDAIGLPPGKLAGETSPFPAIAKHLGDRPVLIVMDNCEHVIDDAARTVAALRDECPSVSVLATSREPLELAGESVHQLGVLSQPEAVRLMNERAESTGVPDLDPDVVPRLVAAVDGLPLGIELAVARLRQMSGADLAAALEADVDALQGRRRSREQGAAERSGRHATLRSLIAWSYDLLDADERTLLLRLSTLHAPWNRTTAALLTPDLDPHLLDELIAKSLVSMDRSGTFRMLESVRQFCASVLADDSATAAAADDALVDWALHFAPPVDSAARLVFDPQRTRELNEQSANLQAALEAAGRRSRHDDRAALVTGLWPLVVDVRARRWFDGEVLTALEHATVPATREILIRLAFQGQVGDHIDATRQEQLIRHLEGIDPDRRSPVWGVVRAGEAVGELVAARLLGGDQEPVRAKLRATIDLATESHHTLDRAISGVFLSFSHLLDAEGALARTEAMQAADWGRACNFVPLVGLAEAALALGWLFDGEVGAALDASTAALPLGENARWESSIRAVHVHALERAGHATEARRQTAELISLVLDDMNPFLVFDAIAAVAALHAGTRDLAAARAALDQSSVSRTPLTTAILVHTADAIEFDLGLDRFAAAFDPDAFAARGRRAAEFLRAERAALDEMVA